MNFLCKSLKILFFIVIFLYPFCIHANENIHKKLLKRNIPNKIINVNKLIKEKGLDKFVTLSVVVNDEIIYCHYEKENRSKLKLIMCY